MAVDNAVLLILRTDFLALLEAVFALLVRGQVERDEEDEVGQNFLPGRSCYLRNGISCLRSCTKFGSLHHRQGHSGTRQRWDRHRLFCDYWPLRADGEETGLLRFGWFDVWRECHHWSDPWWHLHRPRDMALVLLLQPAYRRYHYRRAVLLL